MRNRAVAVVCLLLVSSTAALALEGFGSDTPGGKGQPAVRVTNLNDSGSGSLREALSGGNRRIVFDVAGEIFLESPIRVRDSFITVMGGSAPSPGITLLNSGIEIAGSDAHDIIIRRIRIRDAGRARSGDGLRIQEGAHRVVIHRVSIDNSTDGNLDITKGAHDVTISRSVLSGAEKNMLVSDEVLRVSVHHNVFVNSQFRNPFVRHSNGTTNAPDTTVDARNNVIWQWGEGGGSGVEGGAKVNLVNNFYSSPGSIPADQGKAILLARNNAGKRGKLFTSGNVSGDPIELDINREGQKAEPFPAAFVTTTDACSGAENTLARAGAPPLDARDTFHLGGISISACVPPAE